MQLLGRIPNFDEPIDALEICHENITKRMKTIAALAEQVEREGFPALQEQRETWRELFSFITHNISKHSRDEEEGLFPMLRATIGEKIDALERDHEWAEEAEHFLIKEFDAMIDGQTPTMERLATFTWRARELSTFYQRHIEQENSIILPAARASLSEEQLRSLGNLMRSHRKLEIAMPKEEGRDGGV